MATQGSSQGGATNVSIPAMVQALQDFANAYHGYGVQLENIETQRGELEAIWRADSARLFGGALGEWMGDFKRIVDVLGSMAHTLEDNIRVYAQTHETTNDAANQAAQIMSASTLPAAPRLPGIPGV